MRISSKSIVTCFVLGTFGFAAACTSGSSSDGNDDGSDESGGGAGKSGGSGGSKSGGSGGKSGGSGGSADGGSGGSANGGSGGTKAGGSGGSANGGSGGSANGGSGGSANGGSGGQVPAISGEGVVFSGKEMTLTKLVAGDTNPGYFYASPTTGGVKGVKVEAVSDAALPEGTKYAMTAELNVDVEGNFFFGWNWREDQAGSTKWKYADLSQYAGLSFWAKTETTGLASVFESFLFNDTNFSPTDDFGGICAATPCPPATIYDSIVVLKTWTKHEIRFSVYVENMPKLGAISRVDLMRSRIGAGGPSAKVFITGMKLLKESELTPL